MYKIGEFSILSKTTIKTLRYYEKEGLLKPSYIDKDTNYRYYEARQLTELSKIISLRQLGASVKDIRSVMSGKSDIKDLLNKQQRQIENMLKEYTLQFSKIKFLLEENNMNKDIIIKDLPECVVYFKDGVVKDFSEISSFILGSAQECIAQNPNIKCVSPDYCFVSYLDGEYKEKDLKIRYAQAVEDYGVQSETIKFMRLKPVKAVCIYHKGSYATLRESYNAIMKYIEQNNYKIVESPRECYIDGIWNKQNEQDWLTEIQVPIAF